MIDCSRNGVMRVEAVKFLLRQLALMGTNCLQVRVCSSRPEASLIWLPKLYCEDTYSIPVRSTTLAPLSNVAHTSDRASLSSDTFEDLTPNPSCAKSTTTLSLCATSRRPYSEGKLTPSQRDRSHRLYPNARSSWTDASMAEVRCAAGHGGSTACGGGGDVRVHWEGEATRRGVTGLR